MGLLVHGLDWSGKLQQVSGNGNDITIIKTVYTIFRDIALWVHDL